MNVNPTVDGVLRHYLLGTIDPAVREDVERRLFSDDRIFWEQLCLAEDELIDDYVDDELDAKEVESFERCFLSTEERREKLEFARALKAHVEKQQSTRRRVWYPLRGQVSAPSWAVAMAAMLLLVLPAVAWQFAGARAERDEVSAWLASGLVRGAGGELTRVQIPLSTKLVRLHLEPDGEYRSYRATLHLATGDEIWSQTNLTASTIDGRAAVTLTLPSELLPTGDYYVRLQGVGPRLDPVVLDRFDFRVLRQ